jgi:Na+-transporting NADH:ubiquinone oxidoreductase subunit A
MSEIIKIKKGLDIKIAGEAKKSIQELPSGKYYAIKPTDFESLTPKMAVKVGDKVKIGSTLFFDKYNPKILFSSPVSGTVSEVFRGERRKILEVVIESDNLNEREDFEKANPDDLNREQVIEKMLASGLWPFMRQRPYGIIANPEDKPKSIFVSTFNTAPLAADTEIVLSEYENEFKEGIKALNRLTDGDVNLGVNGKYPVNKVIASTPNVKIHKFVGKHPAGNVGTQINKIDPINKGETVWYLYVQDIIAVGRLFLKGYYDSERIVALAGSEVEKTGYFKTTIGTSIKPLIENNIVDKPVRYISGNVLTGTKIQDNGYLGFYDDLLTVIPEQTEPEVFGWIKPGYNKFSNSKTFISKLFSKSSYNLDTRLHGNERAFVVTGEYEKVFPLDIYPTQLLKAIIVEDIDKMEQLGIYEVTEEDFALCEFVCTSKIEAQQIVRDGINIIRKELE